MVLSLQHLHEIVYYSQPLSQYTNYKIYTKRNINVSQSVNRFNYRLYNIKFNDYTKRNVSVSDLYLNCCIDVTLETLKLDIRKLDFL